MTYTAADWQPALDVALSRDHWPIWLTLLDHGIYADHCGGYDVHAWPCPVAAEALRGLERAA